MLYFDTSFLVPLFLEEATSPEVARFLDRQQKGDLFTSQWTRVEFASLLARDVRMGYIDKAAALDVDAEFNSMIAESFIVVLPVADDFEMARQLLRRHTTNLRAGDALHLAIAANRRARVIHTLDGDLVKAGRILGLPVRRGIRSP